MPKGTRLKNHTHHPLKKNTTKHQKAPPTTTKPHLLHFSFMRARNTTKLRGRQATAAVCFHAQIKPLLRACSPTVSALLAGGRWDPWVRPTQQRASSSSPREIHPLVWLAGLLSPAVSRLVRAQSCVQTCEISHSLGMLGAASITSPTHPSPFRLKGHPPQGVTHVPNVQQVLYRAGNTQEAEAFWGVHLAPKKSYGLS